MIDRIIDSIEGLSEDFEEQLAELKITSWEDFLNADSIPNLSPEKKKEIDGLIKGYKKAIEEKNFRYFTFLPPKEHWRLFKSIRNAGKVYYLDIESTGRQIFHDEITVVGLYDGNEYKSLVSGVNLDEENLNRELSKCDMIITHRGMVFDLPFLEHKFPNVNFDFLHVDLSFSCRKLELPKKFCDLADFLKLDPDYRNRKFESVQAVKLWEEYSKGSPAALDLILEKNRGEVMLLEKMSDKIIDMLIKSEQEAELEEDLLEDEEELKELLSQAKENSEDIKEEDNQSIGNRETGEEGFLTAVKTDKAPEALGPYSQAVRCQNMLFISGQLPIEPDTGRMAGGGFGIKTKRAMDNIGAILNEAGLDFKNLVKVTIYTTQLDKFQQINEAYSPYFGDTPPARAVVGVDSLPKGAEMEIEAIAVFE